jgi:S-disulfanyl-L-cysteine oxidoreductase SoxD
LGAILALALFGLMAPITAAEEANDNDTEDARTEQVIEGEALYGQHCAVCHGVGEEGERRTAPALIGERHRLGDYGNAQRLHNYVSRAMPLDNPGGLEEEEYWAILALMLDANDLLPEETELGPENAEEIGLEDHE